MDKEQLIQEIGKPILRTLGWLQAIFIFTLITSPFIGIWHDWGLGFKVALSSILIMAIISLIYHIIKKIINELIDENFSKESKVKNTFQEKLDEKIKNSKK